MFKLLENHNKECLFFERIKAFWTILNNEPLISKTKISNKRNETETIMIFDLSTLYTKILHDKLLRIIYELINICFDGDRNTFFTVTRKWISDSSTYPI